MTKQSAAAMRVYGIEPEWDSLKWKALLGSDPEWAIHKAVNWYYQNTTAKEIKKYVLEYLRHIKSEKSEIDKMKRVDLKTFRYDFYRTGFLGRMVSRGAKLPKHFANRLDRGLADLLAIGAEKAKAAKENETAQAKRPTIQDRIEDQVGELLADLESEVDGFLSGIKKRTEPNKWFSMAKFLTANEVKGKQTTLIADNWRTLLAEVTEAQERTDDQLTEAYEFLTRPQLKRYGKFLEAWVSDCESHGATKRKTRKKKVKTPEQLVAKLQYLPKSKEYKVSSVDPKGIIGADCVVIFNEKYRLMTIYRAADAQGMSVKGTTLLNFSTEKSIERRLRKPKPMLAVASKLGLRAINSEFKNVRTTDRKPTGRLNKNCVIVRIL